MLDISIILNVAAILNKEDPNLLEFNAGEEERLG